MACGTEDIVAVVSMQYFDGVPDDCDSIDRAAVALGYEGWNDGGHIYTKVGSLEEGAVLHTGIDGQWARVGLGPLTYEDMLRDNIDYRGRAAHLRCSYAAWAAR